jgi:two-component system OmpR family sensor kinase
MKTIRSNLFFWLALGLLLSIFAAAAGAYRFAHLQTDRLLDAQMQHIGDRLVLDSIPTMGGSLADLATDETEPNTRGDPDEQLAFVIEIWDQNQVVFASHRSVHHRPIPLTQPIQAGFDQLDWAGHQYRSYSAIRGTRRVTIAEPIAERVKLSAEFSLRLLLPFLVLIPLILVAAWFAIDKGLAPLRQLSAALERRRPEEKGTFQSDTVGSDLAPLVQALNKYETRIQAAQDLQRAFVADAAHELRTPLTALSLQLELLEQGASADQASEFARVRGGVARSIHLTQQLLAMSRADAAGLKENSCDLDLNDLVKSVVAELEPLALAKQLRLRTALTAAGRVNGVADQLALLIRNLLHNAITYSGPNGAVQIETRQSQGVPELLIADQGPGIPLGERERVFDRFHRVPGSPGHGSGLGLSIVRRVANLHGAHIQLDTGANGHGLLVTVRFASA